MNRRDFVSRVSLGAAAVCTPAASPAVARTRAGLNLRFVGMMGFIRRSDGSYLVATPGNEATGHMAHQPFLMARRGTRVANALKMSPATGVVPGAFDMRLADASPEGFVYRCLDNTSLDVVNGADPQVKSHSTQMAQLAKIVPGARVRGNLERWARTTVSLRGGLLEDSAAHPDAGRMWSFGHYRQRLTDAIDYVADGGTEVRLVSGNEVEGYRSTSSETDELWVISAALARESSSPTRLEHSQVAFQFLSEATPIIAECAEAVGREVPETALPCSHASSASLGLVAEGGRFPPYSEICYMIELIKDIVLR